MKTSTRASFGSLTATRTASRRGGVNLAVVLTIVLGAAFIAAIVFLRPSTPAPEPDAGPAVATPDTAAAVLDAAHRMLAEDRVGEAGAVLAEAVRTYPDDAEIQRMHGDVLMQQERFDDAYSAYEAVLALGERSAGVEFTAGTLASMTGQTGRALEHFAAAALAEPGNADYALYHGQALIAEGEVDAGRAQLVRATVIDDSRAVAWGALAELALRENKVSLALQHAAKARTLEPERTAWRVIEARAATRGGEPQRALDVLEGLDDAHRAEPGVLEALAGAYGMMREPARALAAYERAVQHTTSDPELTLEAALWAERAGEIERAIELAERAGMLGEARGADLASRLRSRE